MNRVERKFKELKQRNKKAFVAFITAGDPSLRMTEELVLAFEGSGVDIIELGVPFSDPLADGPTIQAASQRALKKQVNLDKILNTVFRIRKHSQIPICLMSYYNPIYHYGEEEFVEKAKEMGVDGVIIPDLPPEEADILTAAARTHDLSTIFFLSPTTSEKRLPKIVQLATGFIYYVSIAGVTGARTQMPLSLRRNVKKTKKITDKPVCVGFGISSNSQVKKVAAVADGVIVGSAIVNEIAKNAKKKDCVFRAARFVSQLTAGL